MNARRFPDRRMTDLEMEASNAMRDGNLVPLARLLAEENHEVHPLVQRALLNLIAGSAEESDHRIFVDMNPALKDKRHGRQHQLKMQQRDLQIALQLADGADFVDGEWDWGGQKESIVKTIEEGPFALKRASVYRIWAEQEPFIRFCISHGSYQPRNLRTSI